MEKLGGGMSGFNDRDALTSAMSSSYVIANNMIDWQYDVDSDFCEKGSRSMSNISRTASREACQKFDVSAFIVLPSV